MAVLCLPWLRWKAPQLERPIKISLIWPIVYLIATAFITAVPMIASPVETGKGILMILSSIPVYYVCIYWTNKPQCFVKVTTSITTTLQRLLIVVGKTKAAEL